MLAFPGTGPTYWEQAPDELIATAVQLVEEARNRGR